MYMGKGLIEYKLYQIIDQSNKKTLHTKSLFQYS